MEKTIKQIMKIILNHNFEVYLVGGYTRDYLLNKKSYDIDIATNAPLKSLIEFFPQALVDKKHLKIKFQLKQFNFDISCFRHEIYENGALKITKTNDLLTDAKRRDFTMNAIYMDINKHLIDPFNGYHDLKNNMIKVIGDVDKRLLEDPLRILRALRFKYNLNFSLELNLENFIKSYPNTIKNISYYQKKKN